jgi:type IV pilus assembly protein PilO
MDFKQAIDNLSEIQLSELTLENAGAWPVVVKIIVWFLVFSSIVIAGYYGVIEPMEKELDDLEQNESFLKSSYQAKAHVAANLEAYRKQMKDIEKNFGALLGQLPSQTEVPGLLDDISDAGVVNGLQFKKIGLGKERKKEFYVELPINISVGGDYHNMGAFVSSVAALPRIVTLHDFSISLANDSSLAMEIEAKTYRYQE